MVAVHRERDSLGLDEVKRLEALARAELLAALCSFLGEKLREVVEALGRRRNALATGLDERVLGDIVRDGRAGESSVGGDAVGCEVYVATSAWEWTKSGRSVPM